MGLIGTLRLGSSRVLPLVLLVAIAGAMRNAAHAQEIEFRPAELGLITPEKLGSGTSSITGAVADAGTGAPVPGAVVSLGRTGTWGSLRSALSDSRGRFVFTELPADASYTLKAHGPGYAESPYAGEGAAAAPERRPAEIALADHEWRQGVEIRLWRLAEISGVVVDELGEPLVGVAVRAFTETVVHSKSYLAGSALASTDDRGFYRLTGLRSGSYVVGILSSQSTVPEAVPEVPQRRAVGALMTGGRSPDDGTRIVSGPTVATADGHRLVVNSLTLASPDRTGVSRAYQPVFYPSEPNPGLAQAVSVAYGQSRGGVDFRLQPVRTFRVSGTIPASIRPDSVQLLRLLPRGFERLGLGNETATTVVDRNGSFTFLGVPSGQYTLITDSGDVEFVSQHVDARMPDPAGYSAGPVGGGTVPGMPDLAMQLRTSAPSLVWGRLSVDVANADVADLVLPLQATLSIRGRVELEEGAVLPASQRAIHVTAEPADGDPALGRPTTTAGRGLPGDSFSLDGLQPGIYLLRGSYFPVRSITWQGRDITDVGVDLTAGNDVEGVVITLTARGTELTGSVSSPGGGRPLMAVLAFPADPALWSNYGWTAPRRLRSVPVRTDGTYAIRNLPGGDYLVVAVEAQLADAWVDPRFLAAAASQASGVTIRWGERVTQDLSLRTRLGRPVR